MSWRFLNDGRPLLQGGVSPYVVQVQSQDKTAGGVQNIPGLSAYTAHKTLGHYKDPNGAQVRQKKELQTKCEKAANFISRSPLTREEAWTYWRSPCQAGKLLRIAVAWTQHNLGTSQSFLQDTTTRLPHMESRWLKSLREYLQQVKGHIQIDHKYISPLARIHDCFIMDAIIDSHHFNDKEIQRLNYCRLFLQAVTLSDLTNASGTHLDKAMLRGYPDQCSSVSRWHHVTQGRPDDAQWQLWQRANRLWSTAEGALKQPLTRWIIPVQRQRRQWQVYGDMKGRIYVRQQQGAYPDRYIRYQVATKNDAIKEKPLCWHLLLCQHLL